MRTGATGIAALGALLALGAVRAAAEDPNARGFDPDPARLALSVDGGLVTETAGAAPPGAWDAAFVLDYASGLLALRLGNEHDMVLESRLSAQLLGAYSFGRLELGAHLPVALAQASDFSLLTGKGYSGPLVEPIASAALGDLRLGAKLAVLEEDRFPLGLAALLEVRLPTGNPKAFTSDGFMVVPGVVASRRFGALRLDGQLGYQLRGQGQYAQLVVHDMLTYAAGVSYDLPPAGKLSRWRAMAELFGGYPRGDDASTDRYRAPLSVRAGLRAWVWRDLAVEAGAGTGLGEAGYGRESWRVFGGVRWTSFPKPVSPEADRDHDGVPDAVDRCPDQPGPAELDGCPDRDGDGIPDIDDRCPDQPGPAENDGCPVGDEPLVELETERLSLKDAIHFDTGRDTIRPESSKILDAIAGILAEHPELKKVRVEGHTDNVGSAAYNKDLSQRRAQAVVRALVARKIDPARLVAQGYGFERPIASNDTALGRAKNRRVEFTILSEQ